MSTIIKCVKCSATNTTTGKRCKRTTCKYSNMCWQHTRKDKHLKVAKSTITGAKLGLFTTKPIKKGQHVVNYTGKVVSADAYQKKKSGYGVYLNKRQVLDASSTQSALGRYVNDCRVANRRDNQCRGNNARFVVSKTTARLKTTRKIKKGEEILVSYGRRYWKKK